MSQLDQSTSIQRTVSVPAPIEQAFHLFTDGMTQWWPAANTFSRDDYHTVVIEPRVGGRWYERNSAGEEIDWGRVIVWEPPHRVTLTWQITAQGTPDPDPTHASKIDVRFRVEAPESTLVEVTHGEFARHGGEASKIWYDGMDSDETGWTYFLRLYKALVTAYHEQQY